MILAAQAAAPVCPRCGHAVRGGVALQAAAADIELAAAEMAPLARSAEASDRAFHGLVVSALIAQAEDLRAELSGGHQQCGGRRDDAWILTEGRRRLARVVGH